MLVDEDLYLAYKVDAFLEHHGVPGMHWGYRHPRLRAIGRFVGDHKKLIIGAAAVGVVLGAHGASVLKDSGELNAALGKNFTEGIFSARWKTNFELSNPGMSKEKILSEIVKPINKGFDSNIAGTKTNCRRATFAYELRRRGYNVAATRTSTGAGQTAIGLHNALLPGGNLPTHKLPIKYRLDKEQRAFFKEEVSPTPLLDTINNLGLGKNRIQSETGYGIREDIFHTLSKQPERSRGELAIEWTGSSVGHSMAYEVINGKAVIFDAQSGTMYRTADEMYADSRLPPMGGAGFTRLDNTQLDEPFLERWVKNANP